MKMTLRFGLVVSALLLLSACGEVQPPPEIEATAVREGARFSGEGAFASSSSQDGVYIPPPISALLQTELEK
jgi:outer membrane biogenesis lipoprotein LolB